MAMYDTDAKQVADEMIGNAKERIEVLERVIGDMKRRLEERKPGRGFPTAYCDRVIQEALYVHNEISRANGAVLVRSTK